MSSHFIVTSPAKSVLICNVLASSWSFTIAPDSRSPFFKVTWSALAASENSDNHSIVKNAIRRIHDLLFEILGLARDAGRSGKSLAGDLRVYSKNFQAAMNS